MTEPLLKSSLITGLHKLKARTELVFFAGDWLHRRYTYPEIWRQGNESRAIALTSPLPFLTCGIFAYVIARLGLHSVGGALGDGARNLHNRQYVITSSHLMTIRNIPLDYPFHVAWPKFFWKSFPVSGG